MPDFELVAVRKRCTLCGYEWRGLAFVVRPEPVPGICDGCCDEEDARVKELRRGTGLVAPRVVEPVLARPLRTGE